MVRVYYPNGSTVDAVILSLRGRRMRVAINGGSDVVEFRFVLSDWITESGEVVVFDFLEILESALNELALSDAGDSLRRRPSWGTATFDAVSGGESKARVN